MDLKLIFKGAPSPCIILAADSPSYTIMGVNDAYLQATHTTGQELITKSILAAFPVIFNSKNEATVKQLAESLNQVLVTKSPQQLNICFHKGFLLCRG
jgi:hypothetical protein